MIKKFTLLKLFTFSFVFWLDYLISIKKEIWFEEAKKNNIQLLTNLNWEFINI